MATTLSEISASVGIRNGQAMMPNTPGDLDTVTDLFDRIPVAMGGSKEIGGVWSTIRPALIAEVTAQIVTFQTTNHRPVIDGVIDRNGGTLRLMNQLADEPPPAPVAATVVAAPNGYSEASGRIGMHMADVNSLPGRGPLRPVVVTVDFLRKLVRVDKCSIKWFGVVIPNSATGPIFGSVPHINFTPTPIQGHYRDQTYDSFGGWGQLWLDYTAMIGSQVSASGADQILVLPFYRTSQSSNLGGFLLNWQDVVSAVVTAAINAINPYQLRDTYTFDHIVSSSFSNGWVAHKNFNSQAVGAAAMTNVIFDLDGAAGGSNWRPSNGIIYQNRKSGGANPAGNVWFVGERWAQFAKIYPPGSLNTHACCRNHLLYHGLWLTCT